MEHLQSPPENEDKAVQGPEIETTRDHHIDEPQSENRTELLEISSSVMNNDMIIEDSWPLAKEHSFNEEKKKEEMVPEENVIDRSKSQQDERPLAREEFEIEKSQNISIEDSQPLKGGNDMVDESEEQKQQQIPQDDNDERGNVQGEDFLRSEDRKMEIEIQNEQHNTSDEWEDQKDDDEEIENNNGSRRHQPHQWRRIYSSDARFEHDEEEEKKSDAQSSQPHQQSGRDHIADALNFPRMDDQFYEHSLHYLVQNVNNLREIIGSILSNNEAARDLNSNLQQLNNFNVSLAHALNNVQSNLMNNQNEIHGQLDGIRRLLGVAGSGIGDDALGGFGMGGQQPANQPVQVTWRDRSRVYLRKFLEGVKNYTKTSQFKLDMILLMSAMLIIINLHLIPEKNKKDPVDLIEWLANSRASKVLIGSVYVFLMLFIWYFFKGLWNLVMGKLQNTDMIEIEKTMLDYNPFAHLSLIILTESTLIGNKLEFLIWNVVYFFYSMIKVYNNLSLQAAQKHMDAMVISSNEDLRKLTKVKSYVLGLFAFNLVFSAVGIWLFFYAGAYIITLLFHQALLNTIDAIKILYSIHMVQHNHLYYSNPNTPTIEDPKFKIELFFDTLFHGIRMLHFLQLLITYLQSSNLIVLNVWLIAIAKEINISYTTLNKNYRSYRRFKELSSAFEKMFPIVDPKELSLNEDCAICHEPLRVARKLNCSHKFHIKCIFNWLKSHKNTCPICRQNVGNFDNLLAGPSLVQQIFRVHINLPTFLRRFVRFFSNLRNRGEQQPDQQVLNNNNQNANVHPDIAELLQQHVGLAEEHDLQEHEINLLNAGEHLVNPN